MSLAIDVEEAGWAELTGLEELAARVCTAVFAAQGKRIDDYDVSLVFSGDEAVRTLNAAWRGKDRATNVLSFPAEAMPIPEGEPQPLGDIIMAHGVVAREAAEQGKPLRDHAAHLMIHGLLHLLGHDHEDDGEAAGMEAIEIEILKGLGITNPYE
jgi:probable rRNA maturation factor